MIFLVYIKDILDNTGMEYILMLVHTSDTALLHAFSASEMKLYKHTTKYKWTTDELADTIKLITCFPGLFMYGQ